MNLNTMIRICEAYSDLGWAVQAQLKEYVREGGDDDGLNANAVRKIRDFLGMCDRNGVDVSTLLLLEDEDRELER